MGGAVDGRYNLSFIAQNSVTIGQPIIGISLQYRLATWDLPCNPCLGIAGSRESEHYGRESGFKRTSEV